jgi:acetyl esterase/lipase
MRHRTTWHLLLSLVVVLRAGLLPAAESPDPRRPAAIEADNVPPIPDELWQRLRQYQNMRGAAFEDFSPDGKGILIATRFGNSVQLHRVYEPAGRREQITFFDEPVGGRFLPKAQDGAILMTMSHGGDENHQILLLDRARFQTVLLTDGKSRHSLDAIRLDGSQIIIGGNQRNGRDTDLYLANPRQPNSLEMLMQVNGEHWSAVDWTRDGNTLLLHRYVSINESYFSVFDLATRKRTDFALPGGGKGAIGAMRFSPDGKAIYLASDAESEFLQLGRFDRETRQYQWLTKNIPWDVSDLEVDPETGKLVFSMNEDGASKLFVLENDAPRALALPLGIVSNLKFSPDGKRVGFTLSRPDAPADAYSILLHDGALTRWTFSEVGGIDPSTFVTPQRIQYSSFDGLKIPAYYFRPRNASADQPAAVLINIHGGPESQYRPSFTSSSQFFVNELGMAVLCPNVRGSAGYGKTYLKLDNAAKREDSVKDIGALLDWVEKQPELDADRVAVVGGSYGGFMVLSSLVHFGDRIRAGIDIVGIANFQTFLERTSAYRQDLRRAEYGDERDPVMRKVFERISPANQADRIRSALFVAHGRNDPRVPFFEAEQIAEKVRANGRSVWTVYAANEGHGFSKKDNDDYVRAAQVLFLQKHVALKGK